MLPAVTVARTRLATPGRLLAVSVVLAAAAIVSQVTGTATQPTLTATTIAGSLEPATWAMTLPASWLAAPAPAARQGDYLDLLAMRPGDRSYATPVAYALVVISADERGLVVQIGEDDAIAISSARAGGFVFLPLLRSTR